MSSTDTSSAGSSLVSTPSGKSILRLDLGAAGGRDQSREVIESLCPGGSRFGRPALFIIKGGGAGFTPEMKADLKAQGAGLAKNTAPIGLVCPELGLRLALKALLILAPHGGPIKVTETEADALAWMDTQP